MNQAINTFGKDTFEFFTYLRNEYVGKENKQNKDFDDYIEKHKSYWGDINFHLQNRIIKWEDLNTVLKSNDYSYIEKFTDYQLSVLPINLFGGENVLNKYIPRRDYGTSDNVDPYGIFTKESKILSNKTDDLVLASQKFKHTVLMNLYDQCVIGCSGCYKGYYTREKKHKFGLNSLSTAVKQAKELTQYLNNHPEIYDVIISGGEPLLLDNETLDKVLYELSLAKNLKIIRICTGSLFMGFSIRFDDELIAILKKYKEFQRITINAHLSNPEQINYESKEAVSKLNNIGINIYSQVPVQNDINFFIDDLEKTLNYFVNLGQEQVFNNIEPYMLIVDMHPRMKSQYIPLEILLAFWGALVESHNYPGLERPRTLSILFKEGNVIVSSHMLYSMTKTIDIENEVVTYKIPLINLSGEIEKFYIYNEPLSKYNNDEFSLDKYCRD